MMRILILFPGYHSVMKRTPAYSRVNPEFSCGVEPQTSQASGNMKNKEVVRSEVEMEYLVICRRGISDE